MKAILLLIGILCLIGNASAATYYVTHDAADGDYIYIDDSNAYLKGTYSSTHGEDIEHWAMTKTFTGKSVIMI